MPPRTALFEIATASRTNNYVCRSCSAALGISHPPRRGYARKTRLTLEGEPLLRKPVKTRQRPSTAPEQAAPQTKTNETRPENAVPQDTAPKQGPRVRYFEKDPSTGKITPLPEIEDDGQPEPSLRDIANLGSRTMAKFDVLDDTFKQLDALDGPLERLLEKHGPPGALEAYKTALKSYDNPDESEAEKSILPDLDAEPDPTVKTEEVLADLDKIMSGSKDGSKHQELPELKSAFNIIQSAWSTLKGAIHGPGNGEASSNVNGRLDSEVNPGVNHESQAKINDKFVNETDEAFNARIATKINNESIKTLIADDLDDGDNICDEEMFRALQRRGTTSTSDIKEQVGGRGSISDAKKSSLSRGDPKDISAEGAKSSLNSKTFHLAKRVQGSSQRDETKKKRTKPNIWIERNLISAAQHKRVSSLSETLLVQLEESRAAIGKTWLERKKCDDRTQHAFQRFAQHLGKPYTDVNGVFWLDLWTILSSEGNWNPRRMHRVMVLAETMLHAGVPLTDTQKLLAMEAMSQVGQTEKAVDWWKRLVVPVGNLTTCTGLAFWELGIKLWCAHGDLGRAERASKALLDRSSPSNPVDTTVLLHLIQAYCTNPDTAEKGFELYRRMRALATTLEKPMEIKEYDDVISLFLVTGHTDYAMFAFTDMMFAGTVDLHGRAKLPSRVLNTFFFGKWLKRLIGEGDLDGATKVLVFMQKNGVMAAAVQLNGLIGAWLRTGKGDDRTKAYKLAWAMIHSRETFVDLRRRDIDLQWPLRVYESGPSNLTVLTLGHDELDYCMVPRASTETFVIMATEYRERSLFTKLEQLFVAHKKCEMPGDAMMMNEILAGAVAERRGDKARELYRSMVHEHDILPSTDTFVILFSSLPVNLTLGPIENNPALLAFSRAEARSIFADMMASAWIYSEKHGRRARRPLSEPQAKLILHTFRKGQDYAGLSAAMTGLRDVLEFRLTRGVVLEMIEGVEGVARPLPRMKLAIVRATITLQKLVAEMQARGQLPADATNEGMKDWKVLYVVLLQFYYQKMQARELEGLDGHTQTLLTQAQEEMGVTSVTVAALNKAPQLKATATSP